MVGEEAIFRSADMTYVQLYVPLEISREVVCLLGNLGSLMFRDLNKDLTAFQRGYVSQIRKLDDVERLVVYMQEVNEKHAEATWKYVLHTDEQGNDIERPSLTQLVSEMQTHSHDSINAALDEIHEFESRVRRLDDSLSDLKGRLNDLLERRYVIFEVTRFLQSHPGLFGRLEREQRGLGDVDDFQLDLDDISETLSATFSFDNEEEHNDRGRENPHDAVSNGDNASDQNLLEMGFHDRFMVAGSIRRDKIEVLNRILWRLLRGNLFFQNFAIEEPLLEDNEKVEKDCFLVFTHGETLLQKVQRVVDSLNGKVVSLAHCTHREIQNLNDKISEIQQIAHTTESTLHTELLVVSDQLPVWNAMVKREKYIYATLNLFKQETHGLVAEGWLPSSELPLVSDTMKDYSETVGSEYSTVVSVIHTNRAPPTYHRTNKFTQAFQSICDAYGTATYKEVNPGLATIVTFPFMFAIMFGDLGHGFILLIIGIYLLLSEKKFESMQRGEIFDIIFTGRYVIALMGGFSVYTGLLYNDIFSKSMTFFNSGWKWPSNFKEGENIMAKSVGVYPFGLDYAWHGTDNGLIFSNSYKMKLSVIMGFIHMSYSYMFSLVNYRYRNSPVDIMGNFIPGLIFMQSIFGYLTWAIIFKWSKDWIKDEKPAPSLLNMLINMFLSPGHIEDQLYPGQRFIQIFLLLAALVCVPWLLFYKPLMLRKQHSGVRLDGYDSIRNGERVDELSTDLGATDGEGMVVTDYNEADENEEFNFSEVMIHQVIHTIEFCLNCISHTASYLRLWALSLAHAQLSSVLWEMTIKNAFSPKNSGSPLAVARVVCLFAMWFVLTVCILVLMEGTSAMLHSLRLHWVEAMSKFFEGDGYPYEPFTFKNIME
ncbi:BN860_18272g1_1 [Zygosaccharomyces bailii CLIB 213]|uniref:V-type proton ATPase subunit a n=1 Tax=Zygosaccharomyces bailii (strain CLIB 213 / ATCC 58445 / CBS 680 / BCRC 21525 / NBRC 1098 / NCYC 1416 / NRRL Y-2227) TaxID=1333698 RepID=A0A8J2X5Q8_ZYGB2|nr:BN860_18272g1_1 [Zygosaccharomyces bailii CLIB 213]